MDANSLLKDFYGIFHGCRDKYVVHQPPFIPENSGKMKASQIYYALLDPSAKKENREYKPLSINDYRDHLNGERGIAIEPLTNRVDENGGVLRNICYYGVIDIDVYGNPARFLHLVRRMYAVGFKFSAFVSKSGGLHIYFMLQQPEAASDVVEVLNKIITLFGLNMLYVDDKHKSKVEVFPMHTAEIPGKNSKCAFLPFFNTAHKSKNKMLSENGHLIGIEKALPLIKQNYTSVKEINKTIKALPYSDAPYCIQMLALSGALGPDSGRNKFLFHSCVYFKRKYGNDYDYFAELLELDACMEAPLQIEDIKGIQQTYDSANGKDYAFSCKHDPLNSYCDKKECRKREISGVMKADAKQNENTGADMLGDITRVLAKVPYYLWEIAAPGKEVVQVRFDSIEDLANQAVVRQNCWNQLSWAPLPIKPTSWIQKVNEGMQGIENREIEVSIESDTSELNELYSLLLRYITHKQVHNSQPYMVNAGQVYFNDDWYYFTTEGIKDFLRIEKYNTGRTNLRAELLSFGCEEGQLKYSTKSGKEQVIKCWKKQEDEELKAKIAYFDDVLEQDTERAAMIQLANKQMIGEDNINNEDFDDDDVRF